MEIEVTGIDLISAKIERMSDDIKIKLRVTMTDVVNLLQNKIVDDKLNGGALNRRTGNLYRSIKSEIIESENSITGRVFTTGIPYAPIHEYGGTIKTRLGTGAKPPRRLGKAEVIMPQRSYMRSSLQELRDSIIEQLSIAVGEVVKS